MENKTTILYFSGDGTVMNELGFNRIHSLKSSGILLSYSFILKNKKNFTMMKQFTGEQDEQN